MEEIIRGLMGYSEEQFQLASIFQRHTFEKIASAVTAKTRFVHYTNAETAQKIFSNKEVWLRKSTQMNDFMETQHGLDCLSGAYRKNRERIGSLFDSMFPDFCKRIEKHFDEWLPDYRMGTYLTCVSEHDPPGTNEDKIGRLSMWRAYGGFSGVAIVMHGAVFHAPIASDALKAYCSPVAYLTIAEFENQFQRILDGIEAHREKIVATGEDQFFAWIAHTFRYATLCTKHPGFSEEKEWRIVYSPTFAKSDVITQSIESVGGVPQKVCKLPLIDRPELKIDGISLPKLLDRVIIGPTQYPFDVYEAFVDLLEKAGVEEAHTKVIVSDIPLRQFR